MSIPDGFGTTYLCREGTTLHAVLSEAYRRGASDLHVVDEGKGAARRSCVQFRVDGALSEPETAPGDARHMVTELVRQPPVGLTDPARILIHALTAEAGTSRGLSFEAHIDDQRLRGRLVYETNAARGTSLLVARFLPPT